MTDLPRGTITFMFTDIEGSTSLLHSLGDRYRDALEEHRAVLRAAFTSHGGVEVDNQGDAFFVAFPTPQGALQAAVTAQGALADHPWPQRAGLRVRIGIHTGTPEATDEGYVGADVHLGARICAAAHGGQILVSSTTASLVSSDLGNLTLRPLGPHALKDIDEPMELFQVLASGLRADFPPPRTPGSQPTNLAPVPTPLIGREHEVAHLASLLRQHDTRVVTLTGPGGTGKTRLALEVGHTLLPEFADGVFLVDLSATTDASLVVAQVASCLNLTESGGRSLTATLHDHLCSKDMLVLVDNFEQVTDAAPEIAALASAAPHVRVLVTSREPLRIAVEQEVAVSPLPVPADGSPDLHEVERSPAVALFVARARRVRADFFLTAANAAEVAAICRRLDGLPLALELAAARVKVLSPAALLERLEHSLKVLSSGRRDASERQRTLRGAIAWSYDLLTPDEQTLFRRLGVFAGGFTLEAAEAVCDRGDLELDVLDGLASLVDKSLVRTLEGDEDRFSTLETIREFASERLEESGEAEEMRRAHAQFLLEFAREAEPHLVTWEQSEWLDRLEMELPNVRAALRWSLTNHLHMAAEIAAATGRLWYMRGLLSEGRAWLGEALEACPLDRPHARSNIAWVLAALAWVQGDLDAAKVAAQLGAATAESAKDEIGVMRCVEILALCEMEEGQYDRARRHLQDNLARSSALGDQRAGAITMGNLGRLSMLEEEYEAAAKLAVDSLAVNRRLGDKEGIAASLTNVGLCAVLLGKPKEAEPYLREGIEVARDVGRRDLVATGLEGYAAALASSEDNERAALLLGAAEQVRRDSEAARDPIDDKLYETTRKLLIASMGESELARLVSTGATLSADQVMLYVREGRGAPETTT